MQAANTNPYATPASDVRNAGQEEYGTVKFFSVSGRLGRLRYIAYTMALILIAWLGGSLLGGILVAVTAGAGEGAAMGATIIGVVIIYATMIIGSFMLAIQRVHDFDTSGWITLLFLVPLVNMIFGLILWFIPGTNGENRYGKKTPPNTTGVTVMALLVPIFIVVVGILAAIAIPQYNEYAKRAQEARQAQ